MIVPIIAGAALGGLGGATMATGGFALASQAALIGAGVGASVGGSIYGGSMQANAAKQQAELQNEYAHRQYQYNLDMWGMKKNQLQAQRQEAVDRILVDAVNEGKIKAYKDASAVEQYQYALQIRNSQQLSNEAAFRRSEDIYSTTTDLNSISARAAMDSEIVQLQESQAEARFDRHEAYLEALEAEGKLRARSGSGRRAAKGVQVTMAAYGKQMEMLDATLDSSGRNTRAALEEIIRDKTSADLSAYASRMLDPGELPMPIEPRPLPVPELSLPRTLQPYDFGPQPIMGAMASPSAAAQQAWGSTITSIAGTIGQAAIGYATAGLGGNTTTVNNYNTPAPTN